MTPGGGGGQGIRNFQSSSQKTVSVPLNLNSCLISSKQ
jgi:hypothetical protein